MEDEPADLKPSLRLMVGGTIAIGPGKAQLLDLIRETGSIAAAGRRMGMSYKRAWSLVATMNQCFAGPLVAVSRGGSERGGASVTPLGEEVLDAYRRVVAAIEDSADTAFLRRALARSGPGEGTAEG